MNPISKYFKKIKQENDKIKLLQESCTHPQVKLIRIPYKAKVSGHSLITLVFGSGGNNVELQGEEVICINCGKKFGVDVTFD